MIVGLTGGIGSGKTSIVSYFKAFKDIAIYIADDEAKKLMHAAELRPKLIALFGDKAFENNKLNRTFIADIVFKDPRKLAQLNHIVHPAVKKHFTAFVQRHQQQSYILYENAILFENHNEAICDVIICVTAPIEVRIQRLLKRDHTTRAAIELRMKNQWNETKKLLQSHYIIDNLSAAVAKNRVKEIHNILTKKLS